VLPALAPVVFPCVRVETWFALFETHGFPAGITRRDARTMRAPDVIARLLDEGASLPRELARALVTIAAFSTEDARRDVYNAAEALEHPSRWPEATSPADLVAGLLAQATKDDAVRLLLDAANILRDRAFRPYSTLLYTGPAGRNATPASAKLTAALESSFSAWCASRDFGRVTSFTEHASDGVVSWRVVHEDRARTELLTARGGDAPSAVVSRCLCAHLVTYERARRRLMITTDRLEAATPLARTFGHALHGDARAFLEAPAVDLWKMQELGPASLQPPDGGSKLSVSAIGGTWHSGKSHAITPRGRDFFRALARYKIRIEGGRLDLVTLRAKVASKDGGPAQCDVALRPPHLCTVSEPELAPIVGDFLDRAAITAPEPRAPDFYSRQPWIDSSAGWAASEGKAGFKALVDSGALKAKADNRAVTPPDHPHAGPTATAYPLRGSKFLAWSADPTVAPFVVDEKDLARYALQFGKLAQMVARALGLEAPAAKLDDDGVLACGRRALGPTHVHVFLPTRPIRAATVERLRDAAGHGHAVLVVPEGRMDRNGLRQVAMPPLSGPWPPVLEAIVRALKLEAIVDATIFAPPDARIVLQRSSLRMWLDGVECRITELHFRLLEILIQHEGRDVHTKDIAEHVSRGRGHEDTTRRQIESLGAAITKSFAAAKRKAPGDARALITKGRHGHYVLSASGYVV
jgi:hypothetical protein